MTRLDTGSIVSGSATELTALTPKELAAIIDDKASAGTALMVRASPA
ncbi:MAG: hypothetical protein M3O33_16735 [Cyanobacteriota bacterium]|nr:hypothetical protein [Cyanobacteriota bacterium]